MNKALFIRAISRFLAGLLLVAPSVYTAGTWNYPQGWLLLGILFIPMFIAGLVMMRKNPELLKKRLNVREEETEQRRVILLSGIMFLAAFISAGLSYRHRFLMLPAPASARQSYSWRICALREVAGEYYLSRTVEVGKQR